MSWSLITSDYVVSAFSPGLAADYQQWLASNPDKAGRLGEIASMVVGEFRAALASNPETVMDTTEGTLPPSCLRHASNIIIFQLKGEMDQTLTEAENAAAIRADVFLRGIWMESIPAGSAAVTQTPSYAGPHEFQEFAQ
ncbi:hypothetical protein PDESU_03197 [Pontiella desulfatans]|uniref:Uncharacterized protein n=1 Tax=Pontiella desulfatans TaxID=2750659 RepID=A0A6C2U3N9_PONDE|nr:hypothetical protein [Pontiella desulfatans]VGO14632.1 hypothetical protein PDESU_03197 [Pontiella desulfatans]